MKLKAIVTLLATVSSVSAATTEAVESPYLFKTVAVNGTKYDGKYIFASHISANQNIPIAVDYHDQPAYFKDGILYFSFGKSKNLQAPFMYEFTDYASAWTACGINFGGKGTKGLYLDDRNYLLSHYFGNEKSIVDDYQKLFHGAYWRVCEWDHGFPELFANVPDVSNNPNPAIVPANCGLVNLEAIHFPSS